MKVLGIDPGKRKTWWAFMQFAPRGALTQFAILKTGRIELEPDLPINDRLSHKTRNIEAIVDTLKPDLVIAERFVTLKGRGTGNVSEIINIALGLLYSYCFRLKIPCYLYMPGQHKQWWTKVFWRQPGDRWLHLNPHEADACSLAVYGYYKNGERNE